MFKVFLHSYSSAFVHTTPYCHL